MVVDIEKIKADIEELELMDVEAKVQEHLAEIREKIEADKNAEIAKLQAVLDMLPDYEIVEEDEDEDDECEDEDEDFNDEEAEECENADETETIEE